MIYFTTLFHISLRGDVGDWGDGERGDQGKIGLLSQSKLKIRDAQFQREIWFLRNICYLKKKCSWLKINWQLGRKSFDKLILFESKGLPLM